MIALSSEGNCACSAITRQSDLELWHRHELGDEHQITASKRRAQSFLRCRSRGASLSCTGSTALSCPIRRSNGGASRCSRRTTYQSAAYSSLQRAACRTLRRASSPRLSGIRVSVRMFGSLEAAGCRATGSGITYRGSCHLSERHCGAEGN